MDPTQNKLSHKYTLKKSTAANVNPYWGYPETKLYK